MAELVSHIQAEYPHPKMASGGGSSDYCVGGAFLFFTGILQQSGGSNGFPSTDLINEGLAKVGVPREYIREKNPGNAVIGANDTGTFEKAWEALTDALMQAPECPLKALEMHAEKAAPHEHGTPVATASAPNATATPV